MPEESELLILMKKNAYGNGLSRLERKAAEKLIGLGTENDKDCWLCRMAYLPHCPERVDKSIYDLNLCKGHAYYALVTRK